MALPLFASPEPSRARPGVIVWLFAAIVACLLALTLYSTHLLASARTFVAVESRWAKAQRDAIYNLARYAETREAEDWLAYQASIGIIEGVRAARSELAKAEPDMTAVRAQLSGAGVSGAEVDDLATLYRQLGDLEPTRYLSAVWRQAYAHVDALKDIATRLNAGDYDVDSVDKIHRTSLALGTLEDDFARTVAEMQRTAQSILNFGVFIFTAVLLMAGITVSRRFLAQNARLQATLAENEEQMRDLVDSAPLPIAIVRAADQKILYMNGRGLEQFALDLEAALAHSLAEFHVDAESRQGLAEALSRDGTARDYEVRLRDARGREMWLTLSAVPTRYGGQVCLLVALADIDERKRLQDDMRQKALHDPLTSLPNRAMFMESLERAMHKSRRRSSRFSVLFVDLDHFKAVNDTMGHEAGDKLLKAIADRLCGAVRSSDLVARLAGDEFVVLVEDHGGPEELMIVGQKILGALERTVPIDWREASVSGSVGIATYPEDGKDVATLMRNADAAMYQAKEGGRNNFRFYSPELNAISRQRFDQDKRIRGALARGEFFLEYQPERDAATGRTIAAEALLRWRDPVDGVVLPPQFLDLAEETGASTGLGTWVLERALGDLVRWRNAGIDIKVAVNLSARQLQQPELATDVERLLAERGLESACLRIEVTEPVLMQDSEAAAKSLRALDELGVELAIDNFGTGFSSLGLVRGLPIKVIKIDRSLVSSCTSKHECAAIVQAAAAMSKALGIRVVAQGVESAEQLDSVRALGCDSLQGYFVGRPVDASDIAATMRAAAEQTLLA
jgi:diguanylate cyclase (GGDEF)-like protein/PAS domain S-box-containing protein